MTRPPYIAAMLSKLYKRSVPDRQSNDGPAELISATINIGDLQWRVLMPRVGVLFAYDEHGDIASAEAFLVVAHRACQEKVPFDPAGPPPAEMFRWEAHTDFLNPQYGRGTSFSIELTTSTTLAGLFGGSTQPVPERFFETPDMTNMVFRGTAVEYSDDRSSTVLTLRCVPRRRCHCA